MIKIDSEVRIPEANRGGRKCKYPWREMNVGDSFFIALTDDIISAKHLQSSLISSASLALGRGNVTTSSVTEDGKAGVRVWRTG